MKYSKVVSYDVLSRSNIHRFRVYTPSDVRLGPSRPVLLWLHGGGFVLGSIEADEKKCRQLAHVFNIIVVSVEYRLAPEYPYPAAAHDAYDAIMWTLYHISEYNGDTSRLVVAGEDSGGHLALAATLRYIQTKSSSLPPLYGLVLVYPLLQPSQQFESYRLYPYLNSFMSREQHRHLWSMYLNSSTTEERSLDDICKPQDDDDDLDTALCPLLLPPQLLRRFPTTLLLRATHDIVADEGLEFVRMLSNNYIPTAIVNYTSIHGFMEFPRLGNETINKIGAWIVQVGSATVAHGRSL